MKPLLLLLPILLSSTCITLLYESCSERSDIDIIKEKSTYFDSIGFETFSNYQIHKIREGEKGSYQVSRYDIMYEYAIIDLVPEPVIHRNFIEDTINIDFVNSFKTLECHYLECRNGGVRLDFNYENKNYMMLKNYAGINIYQHLDSTKAIKFENNWVYFVFPKPQN